MSNKIKIELTDFSEDCADGCCTTYGTIIKVNETELDCINEDRATILKEVLEYLGFEVEVIDN